VGRQKYGLTNFLEKYDHKAKKKREKFIILLQLVKMCAYFFPYTCAKIKLLTIRV